MAPLVGRRFLCVSGRTPLKLAKLYDWDWRAGWIRAATSTDVSDVELQVCAHTRAHVTCALTLSVGRYVCVASQFECN